MLSITLGAEYGSSYHVLPKLGGEVFHGPFSSEGCTVFENNSVAFYNTYIWEPGVGVEPRVGGTDLGGCMKDDYHQLWHGSTRTSDSWLCVAYSWRAVHTVIIGSGNTVVDTVADGTITLHPCRDPPGLDGITVTARYHAAHNQGSRYAG